MAICLPLHKEEKPNLHCNTILAASLRRGFNIVQFLIAPIAMMIRQHLKNDTNWIYAFRKKFDTFEKLSRPLD